MLKGGFALELRLDAAARTTKDIDIDWIRGEDEASADLLDAAVVPCDDGFEFTIERARSAPDAPGGGQRWTAVATLAGREFERVAIDVGFGGPVLEPDFVVASNLLGFAGVDPIRVPTVAIERRESRAPRACPRKPAPIP